MPGSWCLRRAFECSFRSTRRSTRWANRSATGFRTAPAEVAVRTITYAVRIRCTPMVSEHGVLPQPCHNRLREPFPKADPREAQTASRALHPRGDPEAYGRRRRPSNKKQRGCQRPSASPPRRNTSANLRPCPSDAHPALSVRQTSQAHVRHHATAVDARLDAEIVGGQIVRVHFRSVRFPFRRGTCPQQAAQTALPSSVA